MNYSPAVPDYRDKWARLLGVPLITGFGYYLTYSDVHFNWQLGYELVSDAVKVGLVWQAVRAVIGWLDRRRPWQQGLLRRLAVQVPLTCLVGVTVLTALVYAEYAFLRNYPNQHYWSFDVVIALIFLLMLNVGYAGLYYYDQYRRSRHLYELVAAEKYALEQAVLIASPTSTPPSEPLVARLLVRLGRREIVVPLAEVRGFYAAEKETYLVTHDDKQYVLEQSLDRLAEQLPAEAFFRANRRVILTPMAVAQVQPESYGELAVALTASARLPARITISRDRAAAFRQWLRGAALARSSSP